MTKRCLEYETGLEYLINKVTHGLILEDSENKLPDVSYETSRESYVYDVKKLVKGNETASLYVAKETSNVSTANRVEELMKVLF